jgi:hypothetical protein
MRFNAMLANDFSGRLRSGIGLLGMAVVIGFVGCSSKPVEIMPKVECRSPSGTREVRPIFQWKYDRVREVILSVLPEGEEGMLIQELRAQAAKGFDSGEEELIGKLPWYVETVSLEMEVRGELERFPLTEKPGTTGKKVRRTATLVP